MQRGESNFTRYVFNKRTITRRRRNEERKTKKQVWQDELYETNYRIIKTASYMRVPVHVARLLINTVIVVETIYEAR